MLFIIIENVKKVFLNIYFSIVQREKVLYLLMEKNYTLKTKWSIFVFLPIKVIFYYACDDDPWSILWMHFKGDDTKYFPLDDCNIIHFNSEYATNRMFFLFDLLFRVLVRSYCLGNFIYISQVLSLILAETYYREKHQSVSLQNRQITHIIRFMYKNLDKNFSLQEILSEFNCSKKLLEFYFPKIYAICTYGILYKHKNARSL